MQDIQILSKEVGSNSSVLNLSLNISNNKEDKEDNYSDSCSNSSFDIPKFLSKNIILKEEKEETDSCTSNFECFEIRSKSKEKSRKRSKTDYIPTCLINNAPKIRPKECDEELVSPLTLNIKTFFPNYSCLKNTYNILYDFQKNLVDCKSCNDNLSDNDIFSDDTERTTPNVNDLNNFSLCRKKMKNIINNSQIKSSYEYENILNSDSLFLPKDNFNKKLNCCKNKKNNYWHKHIIKQKLKSKEKKSKNKNKAIGFNKSKTFNYDEKKFIDTQGLFILGVLESAASEKKKRITMGNCS